MKNNVNIRYIANLDLYEVSWEYLDKTLDFGYPQKKGATKYFKTQDEAKDFVIENFS